MIAEQSGKSDTFEMHEQVQIRHKWT